MDIFHVDLRHIATGMARLLSIAVVAVSASAPGQTWLAESESLRQLQQDALRPVHVDAGVGALDALIAPGRDWLAESESLRQLQQDALRPVHVGAGVGALDALIAPGRDWLAESESLRHTAGHQEAYWEMERRDRETQMNMWTQELEQHMVDNIPQVRSYLQGPVPGLRGSRREDFDYPGGHFDGGFGHTHIDARGSLTHGPGSKYLHLEYEAATGPQHQYETPRIDPSPSILPVVPTQDLFRHDSHSFDMNIGGNWGGSGKW